MSVMIWNVRGLNKRVRRQDAIHHIAKYSPFFVGLLETKVKLSNFARIADCIPSNWNSSNNFQSSKLGRICVFWNQAIWTCTELSKSSQQSLFWLLTRVVYNVYSLSSMVKTGKQLGNPYGWTYVRLQILSSIYHGL